jgi:hypothetical protein
MTLGLTSGDDAAGSLALCRRSFRQRLAEYGTTFQHELDVAGQAVAQQLLPETNLSVTEIATVPCMCAFLRRARTSPGSWCLEASKAQQPRHVHQPPGNATASSRSLDTR